MKKLDWHERVAEAMGWMDAGGDWNLPPWGNNVEHLEIDRPTAQEMIDWLDGLGFRWLVWSYGEDSPVHAKADKNDIGRPDKEATGKDLRDALGNLVLAVGGNHG